MLKSDKYDLRISQLTVLVYKISECPSYVSMTTLQNYAVTLGQQLGKYTTHTALGLKLGQQQLNELRDDQIGQLFELFQEIQKKTSSTAEDATDSQPDDGHTEDDKDGSKLATDNNVQTGEAGTQSQTSPSVGS